MKHLILTTIAAVLVVGCGKSQQSTPPAEAQTVKAPDISIHDAVREGNIEAIKQHIAAGTDVDAKDGIGGTLLYMAASNGYKEIVELLITNGADVNAKDDGSWTSLHSAAMHGNKEIVELLIAKGADVNAKADKGFTPLDVAIQFKELEITNLLRVIGGKTGEELKAEGK